MWLGVDLKSDTKKTCWKEAGLCAQNMLTILGSVVNMKGGGGYMTINEHENLHFSNE